MKRTLRDSQNSELADAPAEHPESDHPQAAGQTGEATGEAEVDSRAGQAATTSVISRKELGRQLRRQAYQKAKAYRAKDPKYLALKEAAKVRRRELYQRVKQSRKDASSAEKAKHSESRAQAATHTRQVREQEQAQRKERRALPQRQRMGELMQKLSGLSSASAPDESSSDEKASGVSTAASCLPASLTLTDVPVANDVT
jgi:hypothetical protein